MMSNAEFERLQNSLKPKVEALERDLKALESEGYNTQLLVSVYTLFGQLYRESNDFPFLKGWLEEVEVRVKPFQEEAAKKRTHLLNLLIGIVLLIFPATALGFKAVWWLTLLLAFPAICWFALILSRR